ncbi:unnamed protein product [Urochloa decumbens]|uniref:Nucleotide-diphospho-sugar transferase domain-containing protein n=1 Tax=Urochloa decumbens TaxID=240449 RepID=A0ABC8Z6P0_9POAL
MGHQWLPEEFGPWVFISIVDGPAEYQRLTPQSGFAGLAELLPRVGTDDGTVIITSVNEAFARPGSLLDVFRESFRVGEGIEHLLGHVLVVAVDGMAFAHCKTVHPHCYLLEVRSSMNLSSANKFMSDAYVELVWTKLSLQQRVLELGYNFLFTDVDIVWLRNPFWHVSVLIKHELAASDLGVRIRFLDTARFAGFCRIYHNDMGAACTMHTNCCFGLENKLYDLREVLGQWRNYTALTPQQKTSRKFTWKDPTKCGTTDKIERSTNP